jgi:hypothetical protein
VNHTKLLRTLVLGFVACCLAWIMPGPARGQGQVGAFTENIVDQFLDWTGLELDGSSPTSVRQLACMIDCLDKKLFGYGKIAVQSPTVFGQNRMTGYRKDYEDQMRSQLDKFELIINSYQRRADSAALTSATSIQAALLGPASSQGGGGKGGKAASSSSSSTVAMPMAPVPFSGLFNNASTLVGAANPDLMFSTVPNLALANSQSRQGIGLEPTVALDERSNYINHLNQLRRVNAGDDASDLPGYGLYLVRMPISLLPSRESIKGKGASVTVKAKHNLTVDVLPNTFRNVVVLDTAYSLMDVVIRGQFFKIEEPAYQTAAPRVEAVPSPGQIAGGRGAVGNAPSTEVVQIFGAENLRALVEAMHDDQVTWYRHDPSVVSWLLTELGSAYGYMREQAHRNNPLFQSAVFEQVGSLVLERRYAELKAYRDSWIDQLRSFRRVYKSDGDHREPIDVLSFALIVQSIFLDRQIKYDMEVIARRKGCACGDPWGLSFYDLYPTTPEDIARYAQAQAAFNAYVECKWPIHIFALDPVVDQQNQLDLFSQRTQLQLALAVAVASGQVNFQNATSYARRTELDLDAIALNRTAVGFGAGESTFGWQFYPRVQTPPQQSNLRRIAGILINNGSGPDYDLENRKIEPGQRECYALVVMPNFVPSIKFTSVANWFDLKTKCPEQVLATTDMVRLGKKLQTAKCGLQRVCDSGKYRPEEVELLSDRIGQLEDMLPVKNHAISLPFEGSLLGSEMFSSNAAGLAPRLLAWYGEPPQEGMESSIFILGNGFSVHEIHVIAGGVTVSDDPAPPASPAPAASASPPAAAATPAMTPAATAHAPAAPAAMAPAPAASTNTRMTLKKVEVISRNVLRVIIPSHARAIQTTLPIGGGHKRKLLDVHVATPNGVSNHLLVEVQPAHALTPTQSPVYALSPDTRKFNVKYALLGAKDKKNGIPVYLGFTPPNAEIDLSWNDTLGIAPKAIDATFNFPNPRVSAEGPLTGVVKGVNASNGTYAINNSGVLDQFSRDLLTQAGALNLLAPDNPLTQLTSSTIDVQPQPINAFDTGKVSITDPIVVSLTPIPVVAHLAPASLTVNPKTFQLSADATDLTIDWPPSLSVNADVTISLRYQTNGASVGDLTFSSAANEVVYSGGKGTISKMVFQNKLNLGRKGIETLAGVAPAGFNKGDFLAAASIFLYLHLDGYAMDPVPVTSPFQILFDLPAPKVIPPVPGAPPPLPVPAGGPAAEGPMGGRTRSARGVDADARLASTIVAPAVPRRFVSRRPSADTPLSRTSVPATAAVSPSPGVRPSRTPIMAPARSPAPPPSTGKPPATDRDKADRPGRFRLRIFQRLSGDKS